MLNTWIVSLGRRRREGMENKRAFGDKISAYVSLATLDDIEGRCEFFYRFLEHGI